MSYQVAILDAHGDYMSRIKNQLESVSSGQLQIHRFSQTKEFLESLSILKPDLLISDRSIADEEWKRHSSLSLFRIDNEEERFSSEETCIFVRWSEKRTALPGKLYRFQNDRDLYRDILDLLSKGKSNKTGEIERRPEKIIFFGSFFGGVGVTVFAQAFAYYWAEKNPNQRILYFDMDPMGTGIGRSKEEGPSGWDRIYLSAKSRKASLSLRVRAEEKRWADRFYYFPYPSNVSSYFELEEKDRKEIVQSVQAAYQGVVIDDPLKWSIRSESVDQTDFSSAQKLVIWPLDRGKGRLVKAAERMKNCGGKTSWLLIGQEGDRAQDELRLLEQRFMPGLVIERSFMVDEASLIRFYAQKILWKELLHV